jgi:hypothetical protein
MDERLFNLVEEYNPQKRKVNEDTRVYQDLNVYGDDADEFLMKYSEMFNVNLKFFNFTDYFPSEGDPILSELVRMIRLRPKKQLKELTVRKLLEGIQKGVLK